MTFRSENYNGNGKYYKYVQSLKAFLIFLLLIETLPDGVLPQQDAVERRPIPGVSNSLCFPGLHTCPLSSDSFSCRSSGLEYVCLYFRNMDSTRLLLNFCDLYISWRHSAFIPSGMEHFTLPSLIKHSLQKFSFQRCFTIEM